MRSHGFESHSPRHKYSSVAQLVEHVAVNHRVISSNLIGGAIWSSEQNWYCPRPESG